MTSGGRCTTLASGTVLRGPRRVRTYRGYIPVTPRRWRAFPCRLRVDREWAENMSALAEQTLRAWVNSRTDLVGSGPGTGSGPLGLGAYLKSQASPASGAYAVISATPSLRPSLLAEDGRVSTVRAQAMIYAGTEEAAEIAATAFRDAAKSLTGNPVMTSTGAQILVSDNVTEPSQVPMPGTSGEQYCFSVSGDFVLYA